MMQCEEIAVELDAYRTGELDAGKKAAIERHIHQCPDCRAELEAIRKENSLYQEYKSLIDIPSRDWIEAHIEKLRPMAQQTVSAIRRPQSTIPWWAWPAVAAVLLVMGLSWHFYSRRSAPGIAAQRGEQPLIEASLPMQQAVGDFEQAIAVLKASYAEKKQHLDPKLVKELDSNLDVTQSAIAECKQVLKKNPKNERAIEFLILDYEKQIDILKQITEEI
jgi:anti-sigma factor RsiW